MNEDGQQWFAFRLQTEPPIICAMLPGTWLLQRTTPTWRIRNPEEGFQRMVNSGRAKQIALAVLDQGRTFPNAIVLATDSECIGVESGHAIIPDDVGFLVVDGQHRLWAQKFSLYQAPYTCLIHTGMSVEAMARLFLEINDTQRRVPSSLRWDLIRLVRPEEDPTGIAAAELVQLLATDKESPFFQRIDLTGEQSEIQIKQGSLAPEFKVMLGRRSPLSKFDFEKQYDVILKYSIAIRERDGDNWGRPNSSFYKARVLRAMYRFLRDIVRKEHPEKLTVMRFLSYLQNIREESLDPEIIRAAQGSAGIKAIYDTIKADALTTAMDHDAL